MKAFDYKHLPMQFLNGDTLTQKDDILVLNFSGPRRVLSTSAWNGGIREDLVCAFNYDLSHKKTTYCEMLAPTLAEHMQCLGNIAGLPSNSTGLCTAAQMENVAIAADTWEDVTVTAIVTAGIDENGGRAGDPASWQEKQGQLGVPVGTVNLMLHFACQLLPGILNGALITATEAKTAAIQELLLPSKRSSGIATGSGTDGAILVCNLSSPICLSDSGKHSKLGEMIGRTVFTAVKRALFLQTGACPERLHDVRRLLGRFGLTRERLCDFFPDFSVDELDLLCKTEDIWTRAAVYGYIMDLENWGVVSHTQATLMAQNFLGINNSYDLNSFLSHMKKLSPIEGNMELTCPKMD